MKRQEGGGHLQLTCSSMGDAQASGSPFLFFPPSSSALVNGWTDIFGAFRVTEMNLQMNLGRSTLHTPDVAICSLWPNDILQAIIALSGHMPLIVKSYHSLVCFSTVRAADNI